jgi:long-chain acyl-CoA synthetase
MNTADYLLEHGRDKDVAIVANKAEFTYADLRHASARLLAEMLARSVGPTDRVAILGNNSLFWVAAYLATLKLGAVAVPFATTLTVDSVSAMRAFVNCKIMLAEKRIQRRYAAAFPAELPTIFDDVLQDDGAATWPAPAPIDVQQDAALMFTSGTTAKPRAVRITHRNIQANTASIIEYLDLGPTDRMMAVLQFFYCFGTSLLHTHLRVGGSLVLSNNFVYPETVLDLMEATNCTGFAGVPSTYQTLLRNSTFAKRQIKSMRKVQQAGGKLQPVLIQELIGAVPAGEVFVMYGQTEATARLSYLPPALLLGTKLASIGRGIPGVTLRVVGDDGQEVKPGEVGEIYARGDNISPGYLDEPEASAQKFVDGVLHTGDLATIDDEGFIFVVDRKADFIKTYGYRVSSQQVENCIVELPEIVTAAVIGEPDLVRGEAIKAFVVLRVGAQLTAEDILAHCVKRLASYMVPKEIAFIDQLPINAHGKIVKTELRKLSASGEVATAVLKG